MQNVKIYFSFLILVGGFQFIFAQQNTREPVECILPLPAEQVFLYTDRDVYAVGENIWFTGYTLIDEKPSSALSKVLYVEILNSKNQVFTQKKIRIENGISSGYLTLPEELGSGYYSLRAYTQYLRNFTPDYYHTQVLTVLNPEVKTSTFFPSANGDILSELNPVSQEKNGTSSVVSPAIIQVSVSQQTVKQRERITLFLSNLNNVRGDFCVSVRKKGSTRFPNEVFSPVLTSDPTSLTWIPELRGLTLGGMVRNKQTKEPVSDVTCILSLVGKTARLFTEVSREDGSFIFPLEGLEGDQNIFIGIKDNNDSELEILIKNDFSTDFSKVDNPAFLYDSSWHIIAEEIYRNARLNQLHTFSETNSSFSVDIKEKVYSNFGEPDFMVDLSDFIQIPKMEEVFLEIVSSVTLKTKNGSRYLSVYDNLGQESYDDPLILLDNIPIDNVEELLKINPRRVKTITVNQSPYQFGEQLFQGIISIHTQTDDFAGYQWGTESVFISYKTLSPAIEFRYPVYDTPAAQSQKKPDFRTTLYWHPHLEISQKTKEVSFYSSDDLGEYEIIVKGFLENGKPCMGKTSFHVGNHEN